MGWVTSVLAEHAEKLKTQHRAMHYVPSFNDLNTNASDDFEFNDAKTASNIAAPRSEVPAASSMSRGPNIHNIDSAPLSSPPKKYFYDIVKEPGRDPSVWEVISKNGPLDHVSFTDKDKERTLGPRFPAEYKPSFQDVNTSEVHAVDALEAKSALSSIPVNRTGSKLGRLPSASLDRAPSIHTIDSAPGSSPPKKAFYDTVKGSGHDLSVWDMIVKNQPSIERAIAGSA